MAEKNTEEKKIGVAAGGISEEDEKLIHAFHDLGLSPRVETSRDLVEFLSRFGNVLSSRDPPVSHHYPKLSIFYGEDNKGETTWDTFKYEITSLLTERTFSKEQILLGVRRSAKGNAADILRGLGPGVSLDDVTAKFESTFGNIETKESILRKFYSCQQQTRENISTYATRLEEIYSQAVSLDALPKDDLILQCVLFHGLSTDIKHIATYKNDTIQDYDKFKIELRRIEADLKATDGKQCHAIMTDKKPSEMSEVKDLLQKLNERIERLEKQQNEMRSNPGFESNRPFRGRQRSQFRQKTNGRGQDKGTPNKDRRPLGSQNFLPTCFGCQGKGHMIKDCPNIVQPQCYKCHKHGHISKNCPN